VTRRFLPVAAAIGIALSVLAGSVPRAYASGSSILGGGSGFAALEIDQWRADTARSPFNLTVNYVAQGSTFGRRQFVNGSFDYAASDIQFPPDEIGDVKSAARCGGRALTQCFVYVPVSAGGLAFMYNLVDGSGNRISNLRLTRRAACKIFTGAISQWNDPEIVSTNPRLASANRVIRPVVRADGAGESYVFSQFCLAVAPDVWSAFITEQENSQNGVNLSPEFTAGHPTSVWPQANWGGSSRPIAVPYADGTANYVADPAGGSDAITYVAAGYAKVRDFPTASLQNAAGQFTQPDEDNVTRALEFATPLGNGTFQLAFNGPDPRAYFPSTYSYVIAQTTGFDSGKGAALAQFLCYAVSQGQAIAVQLRYARLSAPLVKIAIDAIVKIPGAPSATNCPVAGAPPPPPPPKLSGGGGSSSGGGPSGPGGSNPGGSSGPGNGITGPSGPGGLGNNVGGCRGSKPAPPTTSTTRAAKPTTTTTRAATTTTTVACMSSVGGSGSRSGGIYVDLGASTTVESLDAQLARAAQAPATKSSSGTSTVWVLLAGALVMFAASTAWARRTAVA